MGDLTKGSITGHLLSMGTFIAITMLVQTAYFLVDLYFVSQLGKEAVAGVSAAGNIMFLGMAIGQIIGVGVTSLASRAIGAGDEPGANLSFNQGIGMAFVVAVLALAAGYTVGMRWVEILTADAASAEAARTYLVAFLPSIAIMFPSVALGSALRAAGVVQSPTIVQAGTLVLNIALAPVLIAGWGTGVPLGVAGAGWATSISSVLGFVLMVAIFPRVQTMMHWHREQLAPRFSEWIRLLAVGLPAAMEFFLMFVTAAVVYAVIAPYGAEAQAGFGIGGRVLQSVMLPAMAVAFSAAPIVGQNLGARIPERVRETFYRATTITGALMVVLAILMHVNPSALTRPFSPDEAVLTHANTYLQIISWNLVASGLIFTCSGVFQGLGNTTPSLLSSASRLLTFVAPALWLAQQPNVPIEDFWWLSVASALAQAAISIALVFRELRRKLEPMSAAPAAA